MVQEVGKAGEIVENEIRARYAPGDSLPAV
jgi:hypothetical protein